MDGLKYKAILDCACDFFSPVTLSRINILYFLFLNSIKIINAYSIYRHLLVSFIFYNCGNLSFKPKEEFLQILNTYSVTTSLKRFAVQNYK